MEVDEDFGTVRVTRVVSAIAGGRILNPKTARSQIIGRHRLGHRHGAARRRASSTTAFGRFMNHNLADYHVPVNADVRDIEVIFVEERDDVVNPLGAKGLGEIGVVGRRGGDRQRRLPRDRQTDPGSPHPTGHAVVRPCSSTPR